MPLLRAPGAPLRRRIGVGLGAVGLLAAVLLLIGIAQLGRIVPGTHVAGVDVGGLDVGSARRALTAALDDAEQRPLAVSMPGLRVHVRPADVGIRFDVDATLHRALAHGRGGPDGFAARVATAVTGHDLAPSALLDERRLTAWVDGIADRVDRVAHAGDLIIGATDRTVRVVGPQGTVHVDRTASRARVRAALLDPAVTHVTLVTATTLPPVDRTPIEMLADTMTTALRAPIGLEHDGRTFIITPQDLATLVTVGATSDTDGVRPALHVAQERVARVLGDRLGATFERSPVSARLEIPDVPTMLDARGSASFRPVPVAATVTPSVDRAVVVPRRTARQLERMLRDGVRREVADLLIIEPDLTTDEVEAQRPTHALGTFTTRFAPGGDRTVNIARLAALLDGTMVAPGEEFSINRTSGPRSCADGFLPAGTIVRGELVDSCGGGVSQLGTTLLNASFFAGLPLTQWQPHSFYISRYPAGREATLSYPALDVRFLNDTDGWIALRATTTSTSVTVTLFGRPRWEEVRAEHGPWGPPTPFTEVVRVATDLSPGSRRLVQPGGDGFDVVVTRTRVAGEGEDQPPVERWRTVYRPQQRIVEVSPADAPAADAPPAVDGAASDG